MDDVSADTRIRASLIASIEADNFAPCGGTVYARGHVRTIAKIVGVDPEIAIHEFDVEQDVEPPPVVATVAAQPTDPVLAARSARGGPNWNIAMGVALIAICAIAAIGLFTGHGKSKDNNGSNLAGSGNHTQQGVVPPSTDGGGAQGSKTSTGTTATTGGLRAQQASMAVKALTGNCWIEIKSAKTGAVIFSGTLYAGHSKLFESKHGLSVIFGNAPAIDVVVNGHDIGSPSTAGSVLTGSISPGSSTINTA